MSRPVRPMLALVVSLVLAAAPVAPARASDLLVYDDSLQNGFEGWSFGDYDLVSTVNVHSGAAAISFEPSSWGGIYFHRDAGMEPDELESLEFWIHGGATGGQQDIRIALLVNDTDVVNTDLLPFIPGGITGGDWQRVVIRFDDVGVTQVMDGFWLQAWTDAIQPTLWIDDIRYIARSEPCVPGAAHGLRVAPAGGLLRLTWTAASLADVHVVRSDATLPGAFASVDAIGDSGLAIPLGADPLRFYLVAGSNACGEGDLHGETP